MNIPESEPFDSGPTQIESICREWTRLLIDYEPVGFGLDDQGNFLIILEYIQIYGRYYEPTGASVCVIIDDNFSIGSEIQPLYDHELQFSCNRENSYDDVIILVDFLRSSHDRKLGITFTMTEDSLDATLG